MEQENLKWRVYWCGVMSNPRLPSVRDAKRALRVKKRSKQRPLKGC